MNTKKNLLFLCVLTAAMTACTSQKSAPPVQTPAEDVVTVDSALLALTDWDEADCPLYLTSLDTPEAMALHPFSNSLDSASLVPNAKRYTTMIEGGNSYKLTFVSVHEGKSTGCLIGGEYSKHMSGIYYNVEGYTDEYPAGYAFTDKFLADHQNIPFKTFSENKKAPAKITKLAEERYAGKVKNSWMCAESLDKTVGVYRLQFQAVDTTCMGMLLIVDNDSVYTSLDPAYYYDGEFTWHVDDGGEYGPIWISAITRGAKGLDIFSVDPACESVTPFVAMARNGEITLYEFACYYVYVDYQPDPEPVELPKEAQLKAELDGFKVWVNEEISPSEDNPMGQYSVYYQKPEDDNHYLIASNSNPEESERQISEGGEWNSYVSKFELLSCSDAYLIKSPNGEIYLILEGCPDARNMFTYMTTLPTWTEENYFRWIPTNAGFQGLDESGELLRVDNYGYNDDGRYNVTRYYDFSLGLVREVPCE